jgi:hypothetical protein
MTLSHKIIGNAMQMAVCQIADGQTIYADAGTLPRRVRQPARAAVAACSAWR